MRNIIAWLDQHLERWLIVASYGYFCLIILVEVLRRYLFGASSQWGEMTARYAFVLLVAIAGAEVVKRRDHIRIDLVPSRLGPRARLALYVYFDLLHLLLAGLVIWFSARAMILQFETGQLMTGLDANMGYATAAIPVAWTLLVWRVLQRMRATIASWRTTGQVPLGGGGFGD